MATNNNIVADDNEDITQCTKHPFKNTSPTSVGGICPFCLQDKLGKLVSSSSFSPSFRSDLPSSSSSTTSHVNRPHLPFLVTPKKKPPSNLVLSRSKSTTNATHSNTTPRRRAGFWSFLHFPLRKTTTTIPIPKPTPIAVPSTSAAVAPPSTSSSSIQVVVEDNDSDGSPNAMSFERKVTRSRSVGCGGSKSFSVDLLDRISTGFGDCALRRVESQREGGRIKHRHSTSNANAMRCGGLFGGFMMIASSSSSTSTTSSSSCWVDANGPRPNGMAQQPGMVHGRSRSWGWALASPRKVFGGGSKVAEKSTNNNASDDSKSKVPNLDAIPSLLSVRS